MSTAQSWAWALLVAALSGDKPPELPQYAEVRRHVAHDERLTDDERAELLADASVSATEVALVLGVTRQRAHALRKALRP
ncbi:MAG TPA: hypothetical protein PKJ45_08450 [Rubrivivax sp.]|nr:hypothetical protein [Rubrivivax sp.]